jgi:hypothetical protein
MAWAMGRSIVISVFVVLTIAMGEGHAIDHGNLDENRPLRLEDAYPIAQGEIAVEGGAGFLLQRRGANQGLFAVEILYGAFPNFQVGIGSMLVTDPREIDGRPRSGDLRLSGLYNFNQETILLPAFALKLSLDAPTGVNAQGYGVELKGIVTKSIERLSIHVNGGYEFLTDGGRGEREGRYKLVLGASYPIGAPQFTRATLLADVFTEQSVQRGESNPVGAEVGLRYQLTPRLVWDVGVGSEFAGPSKRTPFFLMTGFSVGF